MSIGSSSIGETPIAAQDDPNSKKTPSGQTAPVAPASAGDPTVANDPTEPTSSSA
jgi:hypothetical protein